ncbi:MAG: prepilin-type N-terminal cleavage/methylation domain-containing protein [Planctomycetota bacterium]|nr:MAG: prepilin-type N-terminal cleavage/methylation domain-containing protein [Planctomycetota bacterium]
MISTLTNVNKSSWSRQCFSGFTLIEILVVVAIIALLIAILVPSLSRAKDQAIRAACASNLRQQGIAMSSYSTEHKGLLPYRGWKSYTIAESRWEALGLQNPREDKVLCNIGLLHGKYLGKEWDLLYCPSTIKQVRDIAPNYDAQCGGLSTVFDKRITWTFGGYNYAIPLANRGTSPNYHDKSLYPRDQLARDWKEYIRNKTDGQSEILYGLQALVTDFGIGGLRFVHRNGLNVLYSDLHGRFVQTKDLYATSGSVSSFELWYYLSKKH